MNAPQLTATGRPRVVRLADLTLEQARLIRAILAAVEATEKAKVGRAAAS